MQLFTWTEYVVSVIICHWIGLICNIRIAGIILRKVILATQSQLDIKAMGIKHQKYSRFKDEAQTALFKDPVRTAL